MSHTSLRPVRKVALLTVRTPSGESGGAERLYDGLLGGLRGAGFDADELSLVSGEQDFAAIEAAYLATWDRDLSGYDLVVSTKAPTYVARHPRHVCYLVHTMRVFYDMFDTAFPEPTDEQCRQRDLVRRLDTLALASSRVRRVVAIGREVADRLHSYNGVGADVAHPPLAFDRFRRGPQGDYLFLPGRLHPWKRVGLAIEAMRHVTAPVRLVIAGEGEDEARLRALAADLPRVSFVGRVSDERLAELYAGALGVLFAPLREDYGYITIEAFRSAKPVITCSDSGEAASLVKDHQGGIVADPDARAIARAIDRLASDRDAAAAMGEAGHAFSQTLRWDAVVRTLVGP